MMYSFNSFVCLFPFFFFLFITRLAPRRFLAWHTQREAAGTSQVARLARGLETSCYFACFVWVESCSNQCFLMWIKQKYKVNRSFSSTYARLGSSAANCGFIAHMSDQYDFFSLLTLGIKDNTLLILISRMVAWTFSKKKQKKAK